MARRPERANVSRLKFEDLKAKPAQALHAAHPRQRCQQCAMLLAQMLAIWRKTHRNDVARCVLNNPG
jgi:hypothetical protein